MVGEEREKIWAHKVILAGRCEVFRAMFADSKQAAGVRTKGKESTMLVLPDVRPTVFLTVLEHIYTNSCKLSHTIVVDVLASAIEYGLDGLVRFDRPATIISPLARSLTDRRASNPSHCR